jgi:hypothetical protein
VIRIVPGNGVSFGAAIVRDNGSGAGGACADVMPPAASAAQAATKPKDNDV